MSSNVVNSNSSSCNNEQPYEEAPINEETLHEERNNISTMIQAGANISTITNSIKIIIDKANKGMNRDWEGELQFNVFSHLNKELSIKNCIQFASHKNLPNKKKPNYYFCSQTYPSHEGFIGTAFEKLSKDIHEASLHNGYGITRNGLKRKIKGNRMGARFKCKRCQSYRGNSYHRQTLQYKKISYNSNQSNKRMSYDPNNPSVKLKLTRRRDTTLPTDKNLTCPFSFTISYDEIGFYVVNGMGNNIHSHHPKINYSKSYTPICLLNSTESQLSQDILNTGAGVSLLQNVLLLKTNKLYSRESLKYIRHLHRTITTYNGTKLNTNEKTISFFENNNIPYVMLFQSPEISQVLQTTMDYGTNGEKMEQQATYLSSCNMENEDMQQFVHERRTGLKLTQTQCLQMSYGWATPIEREMFRRFPTVVFCDTTFDTNKEDRPLLLLIGKDSNSKTFTILRALLPNQQKWIFRWVFCSLLPSLYDKDVLSRIRLFITDGDAQEIDQLNDAIDTFFPQVLRMRCGWHIVRQGWKNKIIPKSAFKNELREKYEKSELILKRWMYSWMKSSCMTLYEYKVSKILFLRFLATAQINKDLGLPYITSVQSFFKNNVEPHELHYCFFRRSELFHLGEYTNAPVEGENTGIKAKSAVTVNPQTETFDTTTILTLNGIRKERNRAAQNSRSSASTKPYSKYNFANELVNHAEVHIEDQIILSSNYINLRITGNKWLVTRDYDNHPPKKIDLIPRFIRVHEVTYNDKKLICSCPMRKVYKNLCCHVINVCLSIDPQHEISYLDISCYWWKKYASMTSEDRYIYDIHNMERLYSTTIDNEIVGIKVDAAKLAKIPVHSGHLPAAFKYDMLRPRCYNYPYVAYEKCLKELMSFDIPGSMSQITNINKNGTQSNLQRHDEEMNFLNDVNDSPDQDDMNIFDSIDDLTERNCDHYTKNKLLDTEDCIKNPKGFLKHSYFEMLSVLRNNTTIEEMNNIKKYFNNITSRCHARHKEKESNIVNEGTLISSNANFSKKRKAGGCLLWKTPKK